MKLFNIKYINCAYTAYIYSALSACILFEIVYDVAEKETITNRTKYFTVHWYLKIYSKQLQTTFFEIKSSIYVLSRTRSLTVILISAENSNLASILEKKKLFIFVENWKNNILWKNLFYKSFYKKKSIYVNGPFQIYIFLK